MERQKEDRKNCSTEIEVLCRFIGILRSLITDNINEANDTVVDFGGTSLKRIHRRFKLEKVPIYAFPGILVGFIR